MSNLRDQKDLKIVQKYLKVILSQLWVSTALYKPHCIYSTVTHLLPFWLHISCHQCRPQSNCRMTFRTSKPANAAAGGGEGNRVMEEGGRQLASCKCGFCGSQASWSEKHASRFNCCRCCQVIFLMQFSDDLRNDSIGNDSSGSNSHRSNSGCCNNNGNMLQWGNLPPPWTCCAHN